MQKAVLRVNIHDEKTRKKVLKSTSGFSGIKSMELDDKNEKLTVIGNIDASVIATKLKKICDMCMIDTVEPVKKPEPKPEPAKKPDPPKPDLVPVIPHNHPFIYPPNYANYHYPYYACAKIAEDEPRICTIL